MYTAISVLIFIICVLLILIVLVQNSKGGGLASSFASSNQIMGVRKTTDFLEKATWTLAGGMMILCVLATFFIPRGENAVKSAIQEQIEAQPVQQQTIPDFPDQAGSRRKCPGNRSCNTRRIIPLKLKIECQYVSHTDIFLLFCQTLFSPIFYLLSFFLYFSMIYIFFPPLPFCRIFFGTKYDKKEML